MTSVAARLGIEPGSRVWILGQSGEMMSLLDPLPEAVEVHEDASRDESPAAPAWQDDTWGESFPDEAPEPARPHGVDVAVLFVDHSHQLTGELDELLPRAGSISAVWVCAPAGEFTDTVVAAAAEDYGWLVATELELDDAWTGWRLAPA